MILINVINKFEEFQTLKDQQEALKNHLEIHRMNGTYVTGAAETKPSPTNVKGAKMKISHCPKWVRDQTFESFHNDFKSWQGYSELTDQQER